MSPRPPHPSRDDFDGPKHDIVHVDASQRPDSLNRVQFTVHWLDGQTPSGVRGQVFFADPGERAAEWEAEGRKVTIVRFGDTTEMAAVA